MKKLYILFFGILFLYTQVNAQDCESEGDLFSKYQCKVERDCIIYKDNEVFLDTNKGNRKFIISKSTSFEDAYSEINQAVNTYKSNMNDIYKCALISVQFNSFDLILKKLSKNNSMLSLLTPKIDGIKQKLTIISNDSDLGCKRINKDATQLKLNVLKQTTHETCKYNFYMEYLKEHYKNVDNLLNSKKADTPKQDEMSVAVFLQYSYGIEKTINSEIEKAYKIFPIAFNSYSEYESFFPAHYLLEALKYDFITFRKNLHKTINPINQVVYKISNAMSK